MSRRLVQSTLALGLASWADRRLGAVGRHLPLLLVAALLAGCGASPIPKPTAADATRASAHFPDVTLSELEQGRSLYVSRCGSCHILKRPSELAPDRWQGEVSEMREKNGVKLSDVEARAIVRYLTTAATSG